MNKKLQIILPICVILFFSVVVLFFYGRKDEGIPMHEHTYRDTVVAPTCIAKGYTTHTCDCGSTYNDSDVDALGHLYSNYVYYYDSNIAVSSCSRLGCNDTNERNITVGLKYEDNADGSLRVSKGCTTDTDILIPAVHKRKPVTKIDEAGFKDAGNLVSVTIPHSIVEIADDAFFGCNSLRNITVMSNNTEYQSIDGNLYSKDGTKLIQYAVGKSATSFVISNRVKSIGKYAFNGDKSLMSVVVGKEVKEIGVFAFSDCIKLIEVYNLSTLDVSDCFKDAIKIHKSLSDKSIITKDSQGFVTFEDDGVKTLLSFDGSATEIILPKDIVNIREFAFNNNDNLISVTIPSNVKNIDAQAFYDCDFLTVYCEAESKPDGWDSSWGTLERPVYWSKDWEYVDGAPTLKTVEE
jgi:hypothetical protein